MKSIVPARQFIALLGIISVLTSPLNLAQAKNYDIYVDHEASAKDADGSAAHPFVTLDDAISAAQKNDKKHRDIYIAGGTYRANITLPDGANLTGKGKSRTIIENKDGGSVVTLNGHNKIKGLTVRGGNVGIKVDGKAKIESVKVEKASAIGIEVTKGSKSTSREVTIKDSTITRNNKGLYVQRSKVDISGNTIKSNKEEGLDMRAAVKGTINDNVISSNKEGGIELVVGNSKLEITDNKIKGNRASGISAQFYKDSKANGEISIADNKIEQNGDYSIDCGIPSGGDPSDDYWSKSLLIGQNMLDLKKEKPIASRCDIESTTAPPINPQIATKQP